MTAGTASFQQTMTLAGLCGRRWPARAAAWRIHARLTNDAPPSPDFSW